MSEMTGSKKGQSPFHRAKYPQNPNQEVDDSLL